MGPLGRRDMGISGMDVLNAARAKGVTITVAESCTGGLLAGAITDTPGASDVFERGYVTYSNAAKMDMLGVLAESLAAHGAVSEPVAVEMAEGALMQAGTGIALSVTGIAGPGGSEHKPEGRVCFAIAQPGHKSVSETIEFGPLGRQKVRQAAVNHGLAILVSALS